jgi:hypothetical protein
LALPLTVRVTLQTQVVFHLVPLCIHFEVLLWTGNSFFGNFMEHFVLFVIWIFYIMYFHYEFGILCYVPSDGFITFSTAKILSPIDIQMPFDHYIIIICNTLMHWFQSKCMYGLWILGQLYAHVYYLDGFHTYDSFGQSKTKKWVVINLPWSYWIVTSLPIAKSKQLEFVTGLSRWNITCCHMWFCDINIGIFMRL